VPVPSFSPGADQVEARERLAVLVDGALAKLGAGVLPDAIEWEQIDFKEAARHLANEVACMANTPAGGAIVVGIEDRSGRLLGAALDAEWLCHRVYEHVGVAPGVKGDDPPPPVCPGNGVGARVCAGGRGRCGRGR
jgi:ATP-dependent DNA helicase RecG